MSEELFTDRSKRVMMLANQEAQRFNHLKVSPEHILLALVKEQDGVAAHVLMDIGLDLRSIRLKVYELSPPGPDMVTMGKLPKDEAAQEVIQQAYVEASVLNHKFVGTEHLLLALTTLLEGPAHSVLNPFKIRDGVFEFLEITPVKKDDWSKEPPTEPGWYWLSCSRRKEIESFKIVKSEDNTLVICLADHQAILSDAVKVFPDTYRFQKMMNVPQPPTE